MNTANYYHFEKYLRKSLMLFILSIAIALNACTKKDEPETPQCETNRTGTLQITNATTEPMEFQNNGVFVGVVPPASVKNYNSNLGTRDLYFTGTQSQYSNSGTVEVFICQTTSYTIQ